MASAAYSKAVLVGLQMQGMSGADVARITGLTPLWIQSALEEKASLADSHLALIEAATGMSAGQLALRSKAVSDDAVVAVMNAWASTRDSKKAAKPLAERA